MTEPHEPARRRRTADVDQVTARRHPIDHGLPTREDGGAYRLPAEQGTD